MKKKYLVLIGILLLIGTSGCGKKMVCSNTLSQDDKQYLVEVTFSIKNNNATNANVFIQFEDNKSAKTYYSNLLMFYDKRITKLEKNTIEIKAKTIYLTENDDKTKKGLKEEFEAMGYSCK